MKFQVSILICFFSLTAFSQDDVEVTAMPSVAYDSVRSQYIKSFPDHFFIWPVLKQRRLDFEMRNLDVKNERLTYKSNKPNSIGVGMYLFELGFELTFSAPINEKNLEIYGESKVRDLQFNVIGKRFGAEVYHQKYTGFYIVDAANPVPKDTPFPQRPDIESRNIGVTANYVFNHQRFSFPSAYNFAERQLKSGGSFLLFGTVSSFRTRGDSAIIGDAYASRFSSEYRAKEINATAFSIAPGYTFSLIYKNFYLNGLLALGPAHNWLSYTNENGGTGNDIQFNMYTAARLSIGYNGDHFFGGLIFLNQGKTAKFDNLQLTTSAGSFKILFGFRFKEVGILKKRAKDIPKEFF
ncbi:MAG: DUF4421 family protein [Cyclobacteriaceae bacterium]|nr:DUF4421 family protein [Cyclobacteriaceae bacterium]